MGFEKIYITKKGALLAAKTLQAKKLEFDHVEIGSGALTGDAKNKTALTTKVLECGIDNVSITGETQAQITFNFKNTDANNAFYFREIGIFAIDPDTKEKVLFAYANAGDKAEYINNSITVPVQKVIDITIVVDNAANVTITLDPEAAYPTKKEMNEAIKNALSIVGKNYGVRRKITDNTKSAWERIGDSIGLVANFKFDGTNGEVLTKIPEFWYKREVKGDYEYIYIADYAKADYEHSKEFSVGRYAISVDADGAAHSYSGTIPSYNKNISAFRTLAAAVGDGFCQMDTRYFILQLLYLVEYADYNSQSKIGRGVTEWFNQKALIAENSVNRIIVANSNNMYVGRTVSIGTSDAWNSAVAAERTITKIDDYNNGSITGKAVYFDGAKVNIAVGNSLWGIGQKSGQCDELEMKSGTLNNDGCHSMIYRGIENLFGNMWQFVDGININDYIAYVCNDPTQYASDKFVAPYKEIGYTNLQTRDVYTNRMGYDEKNEAIALPIEANGSSSSGTCDYYYCEAGNRIVLVGGNFSSGAKAGLFCWHCSSASSYSHWFYGARLLKYQ